MHVDMDYFFAAVEERENPALKGRPVIVGADPRQGRGRGIVATCNYEARRFGLHSAMPISTAFRRCPKGVYLRPRFSLYSQASRRVMDLLRPRADVFEQAGIDEAYLEVSSQGTYEAALELARDTQAEVKAREALPCSIGIGPNKLIAKTASDHKKPSGITVVIDKRVREFLDPKSVGALRGVGPKTKERLVSLGCDTVAKLRELPEERLVREFGKFGGFLYRQARGSDERPVDPSHETKSIGREHTFLEDSSDRKIIEETLLECAKDVHREMAAEGLWCHTLTVKIRFEGYETHSKQTTLKLATGSLEHLERGALTLAESFLLRQRRVRLVGFSASKLVPPEDLLPLEASY